MFNYAPILTVMRHSRQHSISPAWMLAGLIEGLSHCHRCSRYGSEANKPHGCENVFDHIIGITQNLELDASGCVMDEHDYAACEQPSEPGVIHEPTFISSADLARNGRPAPDEYVPASLLETLYLAIVEAERNWHPEGIEELDDLTEEELDNPDDLMIKGQRALRMILREAMNELEREGLQYALKRAAEGPGKQ